MNYTSCFYNLNARAFFDQTYSVDMQTLYQPFLSYIPNQGLILDIGCGSGRDALNFKKMGYRVEAIDYSLELIKLARSYTGLDVRYQSFYAIDEHNKYHGIWACASLLHCERQRLPEVLASLIRALKYQGICYMSFKFGDQDRMKDDRYFTDLNESQAMELIAHFPEVCLLQQWITHDQRPDHTEQWLNILIQKIA